MLACRLINIRYTISLLQHYLLLFSWHLVVSIGSSKSIIYLNFCLGLACLLVYGLLRYFYLKFLAVTAQYLSGCIGYLWDFHFLSLRYQCMHLLKRHNKFVMCNHRFDGLFVVISIKKPTTLRRHRKDCVAI